MALLLGFVGLNVLLHQSFQRGIGGPEGASQLMMWVVVVGIVTYPLLRADLDMGYWFSFFTGLLSIAFLGLIGTGAVGPPTPAAGSAIGFVLGPVAYAAYAIVLLATTYLARPDRDKAADAVRPTGNVSS